MPVPTNFEAAFDRLFPLAENTARAVVIDPVTAEKIAVETLARAKSRWDRVGSSGDPTAWVLRTAMALADRSGPKPVAPEPPRRSPREQLERVNRRAERLRARRRAGVIALVALLLGSAVTAAIALTSPSGSKNVAATGKTTTTESTLAPFDSTTVPAETVPTTVPPTSAAPATTVKPAAPTTTASLPCRNSSDPRCGTFRWDPAPGANSPLSINVSFAPQDPHPGDTVTFTVHVVDPDASPIIAGDQTCNPPGFGDAGTARCTPSCAPPGYGPWTPPARQRGERTITYTHAYDSAGTYTAHFWFASYQTPCPKSPYASAADSSINVTVSAVPPSP